MLTRPPDQRILKGAPATLRAALADQDGERDTTVTSGVTVTVTRLDGTVLADADAATVATGLATYDLTATQTGVGLDELTVEWTHGGTVRATTYVQVVGRHWFTPAQLRAVNGVSSAAAKVGDGDELAAIVAARTWAESLIEWATGAAWVPRCSLEQLEACNVDEVVLGWPFARTLRSLTIDGVAQTASDWTLTEYGTIRRKLGGRFSATYARGFVVQYDHGTDQPPAPLAGACLEAAADLLLRAKGSPSSRLTGQSFETGTISYAGIDRRHPTGVPTVDAIIELYRQREPVVG